MCPVVILASPSVLNRTKLTLKMRSRVRADRDVAAGAAVAPSGAITGLKGLVGGFGLAAELGFRNFGSNGRIEIIEQMLPRENRWLAVFYAPLQNNRQRQMGKPIK